RDRGVEQLHHRPGRTALAETQGLTRLVDVLADDETEDLAHLGRRRAVVTEAGDGLGHQRRLDRSWPAWYRNVRVGANSPSLWPTIASVRYTGTCLRPSWTAIVWPTMSGVIVDRRDQVLMTRRSPEAFIASTFF